MAIFVPICLGVIGNYSRGQADNPKPSNRQENLSSILPEDRIDPINLLQIWTNLGITNETPWRKSNYPGSDYTYIGISRKAIKSNEVTCEILSHSSDHSEQILIGVEIRDTQHAEDAFLLAGDAIKGIGVEAPVEVLAAFNVAAPIKMEEWEVRDESTSSVKEIRLYFHRDGR